MADITFVTPRYGEKVLGGAEQGVRALATRLSADGLDVEVLTTRAHSFVSWADHYCEGTAIEDGVCVSRFSVDYPRSSKFQASCERLLPNPEEASLGDSQRLLDEQGPTSSALVDAIAQVDSGVLALSPYLYNPAVQGVEVARVPTVLHAAAHPEQAFWLPVFDAMFNSVSALAHYSRPEQSLVLNRFPLTARVPQTIVGLPVEEPNFAIDPESARVEFGLDDEPFAIFLGRVVAGKGVNELVKYFAELRSRRGTGKLVFAGPIADPIDKTEGVVCVGPVSEQQKYGLLAASYALVNPSQMESFSLVVLEAWLAGTAVLVNGWCGPTREHCVDSGGGLWYSNFAEFEVAMNRLREEKELRYKLARAGNYYVKNYFSWPAVRQRYLALLARLA